MVAAAADVAEALHRHTGAFDRHAALGGGFAADHEHAAAGRFAAAQRPPSEIGLPVTTPVDRLPSIMA
jgi:hypothetical protein